jgi:hypothetical protein
MAARYVDRGESIAELDLKGRHPQHAVLVGHCLAAYAHLLRCQDTVPLSPAESLNVQGVLDRLRAQLKFLGEDV